MSDSTYGNKARNLAIGSSMTLMGGTTEIKNKPTGATLDDARTFMKKSCFEALLRNSSRNRDRIEQSLKELNEDS